MTVSGLVVTPKEKQFAVIKLPVWLLMDDKAATTGQGRVHIQYQGRSNRGGQLTLVRNIVSLTSGFTFQVKIFMLSALSIIICTR